MVMTMTIKRTTPMIKTRGVTVAALPATGGASDGTEMGGMEKMVVVGAMGALGLAVMARAWMSTGLPA
jgi:hypothetical protein